MPTLINSVQRLNNDLKEGLLMLKDKEDTLSNVRELLLEKSLSGIFEPLIQNVSQTVSDSF